MKKQLFYIHGATSFSDYGAYLKYLGTVPIEKPTVDEERPERWTDQLRDELGEKWEVFKPSMPGKGNAHYNEWKIWFERHFEWLRDDVMLLGWSQGGYFLAKYLIENEFPVNVRALFLVAAPFEASDFGGEDGGDFAFDTEKAGDLAKKAEKIYLFHSKDDPVVPFMHAEKYKKALPEAELITFEDREHFLIAEFPELLTAIQQAS